MRYILLFWALPMGIFWTWYGLSYNDINFGLAFFSRDVHDMAFRMYGKILGIDPATIPPLVVRACIVDSFIILGIFAFRRRREIAAWWRRQREAYGSRAEASDAPAPSAEAWSRSSTP